jgi:cobalt-zinc-cadmium efflux system outer membrane protein
MNIKYILLIICVITLKVSAQNSDSSTLLIDIKDAKSILLKQNFEILASFYEISNAKANEVQARLWNNPNFVWNQDMYSMELNQYFNFKNQKLIQIEQMIPISGRRRKEINLSMAGIEISEAEYANCVRELLYSFSLLFNELYSNYEVTKLLNQTNKVYDEAIRTAENQYINGLISGNEVIRLKSEKLTLTNSLTEANIKIQNLQEQLKTLLFLKPNITIVPIINDNSTVEELSYATVSEDIVKNRPDYQLRLAKLEYEKKNLELQKANIMNDVKVGYQPHDKGSNFARPYQGLVLEIFIPIFNRNQGNIELSKNKIKIEEMSILNKENEILNQVFTAYNNFKTIDNALKQYDSTFLGQLENMKNYANENYNNKQISILEYIDIQRVYLQTITDYIALNNTYLNSKSQLKYITGKNN